MSGYVPKRVRTERTAMGSTDANSSGKNGHSIVSTIGRRSTLRNKIQSRSFGSMWQIDYLNAAGNKCLRESLVPYRENVKQLIITPDTSYNLTIFNDGLETRAFVRNDIQQALNYLHKSRFNTDKYCAAGAINNNVANIVIGAGSYGNANSGAVVGHSIMGFGRWINTALGWSDHSLTNGSSVYVAFSGDLGGINNAPILTISDSVANTASVYTPRPQGAGSTSYKVIDNNTTGTSGEKGWSGVLVGKFTVVIYGPNGSDPVSGVNNAGTGLDTLFGSNFPLSNEKTITFALA